MPALAAVRNVSPCSPSPQPMASPRRSLPLPRPVRVPACSSSWTPSACVPGSRRWLQRSPAGAMSCWHRTCSTATEPSMRSHPPATSPHRRGARPSGTWPGPVSGTCAQSSPLRTTTPTSTPWSRCRVSPRGLSASSASAWARASPSGPPDGTRRSQPAPGSTPVDWSPMRPIHRTGNWQPPAPSSSSGTQTTTAR